MNRLELLQTQLDCLKQGKRFAAVTIIEAHGLARTGGKMLVFPDGTVTGTVGGGPGELAARADALRCLAAGHNAVRSYDFTEELARAGIKSSASLTVCIEVCEDDRAPLFVLGGGHVGRAVIRAARPAGFAVTLIDDRDPSVLGGAAEDADRFLPVADFSEVGGMDLPANAFFVICTYHHCATAEAVKAVLRHGDAAYAGLLGSRKKLASLYARLAEQGVSQKALDRICAPIGLDIGGETPEEIAVSVVAQLIAVRYGRPGGPLRGPIRA